MENPYLFHHAEEYVQRGWSVIPVGMDKKPVIVWKPYQQRRPTLGEIAVWFGHGSTHQLGIVTGKVSDLVVVDCDAREEAVWWWNNYPRTPLIVKTPRGIHFYYRYGETGNRTGIFRRKIDIRGEGGYVVAPPSRNERDTQYEWIEL